MGWAWNSTSTRPRTRRSASGCGDCTTGCWRSLPEVERVACALYDPSDDMLKTFINSTRNGEALRSYQYRLSDSESLLPRSDPRAAAPGDPATLDCRPTAHSAWVLKEGFQSSFTIPMHHQGDFLGFIFFDSRHTDTFTPPLQRELVLYASIITMAIANELVAIRSIVGTLQIARDFTRLRDLETGAHLERMSRYARIITRRSSSRWT